MDGRPTGGGRLPARLRAHLADAGLVDAGDRVLVAVSGGVDSMALLHLLRFPLVDLGLELEAAHLDHAMRPDSAGDALWVGGVCRAWDVPLHGRQLDPPARSEADARERRYAFLEEVAGDDVLIATGHHRDDQAETVLFRAIRGTGVRGLRGIAARRGRIVRPLLPFRRAEIEEYARSVGLGHREDPTNQDRSYARNRLRHEVMPALERIRPGAADSLARLADRAVAAERALDEAARALEEDVVVRSEDGALTLARPVLHSYHPALRVRVLRDLLRRYGSTPDRAGTRAALEFISSGPSGGELHVAGGVRLERDFDEIRIVAAGPPPEDAQQPDRPLVVEGPEPGRGRARIGGRPVEVVWGRIPEQTGYHRACLPEPAFPLTIRGWRPGDRIRLGGGTRKLKKLFGERRLDRRARRTVPVVADGRDRVVWIAGVARAEGVGEDGVGFEIAVGDAGQH